MRQGIRRGCHGGRAGGRCAGQVLADDAGGLWGSPARYGGLSGQTKQLDAPKETEQRAPADAIDTFGRQLARILGGEIPESAPPKEDEKPEEKKKQYDEAKKLLDALTRTQATLNRLMDENGTFIFADAAEAKKAKQPMNEQAEKLIALSQKDYDPIFGESYELFVATYMQAMEAVAELVWPKERDASADARAWAEKLDFLLDQAYQNRKDMMAVWRETDAVCAAFEKRLEEEREKDE